MSHRHVPIGVCAVALIAVGCTAPPQVAETPAQLISRARSLDLDGRHTEAVTLYRDALEQSPNSFDAHYGIARALDLAGRYEDARPHFSTAIELAPEGVKDQALRMMGVSHTFVRDANAAAPYFERVFERRVAAGNFAGASDVANELGRVYLEFGHPDRASQWYQTGYETAARQPRRSPAQIDLAELRWAHAQARIAARRGNEADARRHMLVVHDLIEKGTNPDQRIHYPYLEGYVDFHLGDYDGAVAALRKADQEDPFILMLLAQALERKGQLSEARAYYREVLTSSSHAVTNAFARPIAREKLEEVG